MPEAAEEIVVVRIAKCKSTGWYIAARNWATGSYRIPVSDCLWSRGAAHHARPVNSVSLDWICRYFHQTRFDHHLLGWFVDLHQHFPDVVDVAAGLAEENRVRALVDLRWIFACKLGRNQRRNVIGPRVTELVAVAVGSAVRSPAVLM